jgi:D-glycero-alpha-D-manno-heptose-7-phosphate kinase
VLGRPVGKQDQYAAAFGGITFFEFDQSGRVHASPVLISNDTLRDLEEHLLMFFTGYSRDADVVLAEQKSRSEDGDDEMLENLHLVKSLGLESKEALERGDTLTFAGLMDVHWRHKKKRSNAMSNPRIDEGYEAAMGSGALGGKLVGAGAGGFLLLYAKDQDSVREAMTSLGFSEVRFVFDHDGSNVIVRD